MITRRCVSQLGQNLYTSIIKFWIHLQSLLDNNIAKRCLQFSKEMAGKNQPGLMQMQKETNT